MNMHSDYVFKVSQQARSQGIEVKEQFQLDHLA